jgi:hypothetical protein
MPLNIGYFAGAGSLKNPSQAANLGYRVNYIKNPSFQVDTSDWTSFNGTTLSRSTDEFYTGSASLKVLNTSGGGVQTVERTPFINPSDVWTVSAYVKLDSLNENATYYLRHLQYTTAVSAAAISSGNIGIQALTPADGWVRLSGSFPRTSGANFFALRVVTTSPANTDIFYVDSVMAEKSPTLGTYFDGSSNGFWTGVPHSSYSGATPYV